MNKASCSPSETTQFSADRQPRITVRRKSPYSQALELQDLLMKDAREATLKPVSRAIVTRAWKELEELKRKMQGKPDPKPVEIQRKIKGLRVLSARPVFELPSVPHPAPDPADY